MLIGGIDEAGSKPKKGTGTFYYFSQQFQSEKQNLNTNKGACLFLLFRFIRIRFRIGGNGHLNSLPFAKSASASWFLPSALYASPRFS